MQKVPLFPLILASASAARRTMLRNAGLAFEALPAQVDEAALKAAASAAPLDIAMRLATAKAAKIAAAHGQALVIGADQILVCEGRMFDKPATMAEAAGHLRRLSGLTHSLATAVCVMQNGEILWRYGAQPRLTMRRLSESFIETYLAVEGEAALACVGAYRLEGPGIQLFTEIQGDFFTILGLPLLPLLGFLRQAGQVAA